EARVRAAPRQDPARGRDLPRHLSLLGQGDGREARQGPLPPRPGRDRGRLPGGGQADLRRGRLMPATGAGVVARVYVTPKRGILDPQGKAVQHSLHALGFAEVQDVKVGKYIELRLRDGGAEAETRVRAMCERLLANGVIEDFRVELASDGR